MVAITHSLEAWMLRTTLTHHLKRLAGGRVRRDGRQPSRDRRWSPLTSRRRPRHCLHSPRAGRRQMEHPVRGAPRNRLASTYSWWKTVLVAAMSVERSAAHSREASTAGRTGGCGDPWELRQPRCCCQSPMWNLRRWNVAGTYNGGKYSACSKTEIELFAEAVRVTIERSGGSKEVRCGSRRSKWSKIRTGHGLQ